jgi:hypothetical protein
MSSYDILLSSVEFTIFFYMGRFCEILDKPETPEIWEMSEWALTEQDSLLSLILTAVPKSESLICQCSLRQMLAGLMSLWTTWLDLR